MGITKQYLRYVHEATFGVIGSINSDAVFIDFCKTSDRYIAAAACENVIIWDSKTANKVCILPGRKSAVTSLSCHPNEETIAVGYLDGSINCFKINSGESNVVLNGHKSAVSCLSYDRSGTRLSSGGKDTEVVIWDVVNEAGLFRLKGHKGVVTCCQFFKDKNILVTSSKDTLIKFWDLDTQHCFKTLIGHRSEVWRFCLFNDDGRIITGCGDNELRVYDIFFTKDNTNEGLAPSPKRTRNEQSLLSNEIEEDDDSVITCNKAGSILREGKDRIYSLKVDETEQIIACHGSDSLLELFKICNDEELKKRLKKKRKKKLQESDQNSEVDITLALSDQFQRMNPLKASGKIRAFDIKLNRTTAKVLCLLNNNSLEFSQLNLKDKNSEPEFLKAIRIPGHRSDVRTLSVSSDNMQILSASGDSVKIWNRDSQQCIITMPCDYALTSLFAPGDKYCVIGTKTGKLQIFDIGSGDLVETIVAHDKEVWSMTMTSDMRGIVSGSADCDVKFWDFELVKDKSEIRSFKQKRLTLIHQRTLKMTEEILCVRISKDLRLIAVSLMDNTVKIFFMDTLKFFLSLYGHKFPVLCMDISDDGTLIATGSADKNIKIWGLDFGDCHKSIFAHDDNIMCLAFVPKTHMFFTAGKDKTLKQWDADNFQKITTLEGHQGEIWALAISPSGNTVVTASHDKSLRLWNKTEELLILEEEQELERESEYEKSAVGDEPVIPGETNKETGLAGKKSLETIAAAEKLMEAIEIFNEERAKSEEHQEECKRLAKDIPAPDLNPLIEAYSTTCPLRFVLEVIKRVKSSELDEALLVLPFGYVSDFLYVFSKFIEKEWETELSCRCLFFLLRVHCNRIVATHSLIHVIEKLRKCVSSTLNKTRDTVGFNLAGLWFLQRDIDAREEVSLFVDASNKFKERRKREKKKQHHILQIE